MKREGEEEEEERQKYKLLLCRCYCAIAGGDDIEEYAVCIVLIVTGDRSDYIVPCCWNLTIEEVGLGLEEGCGMKEVVCLLSLLFFPAMTVILGIWYCCC